MAQHPQPDPALALLAWYEAMGVDEAVAEEPRDWFEARVTAEAVLARAAEPKPPPARTAFVPPEAALSDALGRAAAATTLLDLRQAVETFDGCPLKTTAKSLCFARGSEQAKLMLIGEAPGRDEDLQGLPFVGRAGQLLDKMLGAIGLGENDVYITNVVYWRPPGNRTPSAQEVEACRPFLMRQIELLDPPVIMLLGGPAAQNLLQTTEGIMRLRGKWREIELGGRRRRALPVLHPAYLLRSPAAKRQAWRDMLLIEAALQEHR